MEHNTYIDFFRDIAEKQKEILHGQNEEGVPRESFFRTTKEAAQEVPIASFPALVLFKPSGILSFGSMVRDIMTGWFEVRDIVADPTDEDAVEAALHRCKQIAMGIVAYMHRIYEESGGGAPLPGFDLNSVQYDFTGPYKNNQLGCQVLFSFQDEAFNPYKFDPSAHFNL